ncbi:AAA family ATPase, partial [Streptomyces noursei]
MTASLFGERLTVVEERLRRLYLQHEGQVAPQLAGEVAQETDTAADPHQWPDAERLARLVGDGDRLARLTREFALTEQETDVLVTCLLPEIKPVCGTAFQLLNGQPSSRPTVSVVLAVHGITVSDALAAGLLRDGSPLLAGGLVTLENDDLVFPERGVNVPDRLLDFLTGRESGAGRWLRPIPPHPEDAHGPNRAHTGGLDEALRADPHRTRYLRQGIRGEALPTARAALAALGRTPLVVDPDVLVTAPGTPAELADAAALEGRLLGAAILMPLPPPGTAETQRTDLLRAVAVRLNEAPVPLLLYGAGPWAAYGWDAPMPAETDLRSTVRHPRDRLGAAASAAVERAHRSYALRAATPVMDEVRSTARLRSAAELGSLARHIVPEVGWQDLVLPESVRARLDMLVARTRHRDAVFRDWGLRRGGGRGQGTAALFAGESGTGKTMAAEAVARELGLDLYVLSLPSIVSKYIGETEKNLERVFSAAESLDAVVLFD